MAVGKPAVDAVNDHLADGAELEDIPSDQSYSLAQLRIGSVLCEIGVGDTKIMSDHVTLLDIERENRQD